MPNQFTHPWTKEDIGFLKNHLTSLEYKKIGQHLNRSYSSVQSEVRSLGIRKRVDKHEINSNFFETWSSEMAYVLGFITADGNIQQVKKGYHVHIACDDYDIIEKIRACLETSTPIRKKYRFNGKISYSLRFSDKKIYYDLLKLNITPRKSLTITPPIIPKKYFWDYIRGFFDGDGSVCLKKATYPSRLVTIFYTGSHSLAVFLFENIKKHLDNYSGSILKVKNKNAYKLYFGQKNSEIIFHNMYNNATIFMQRKHNIFLKGISNEPR